MRRSSFGRASLYGGDGGKTSEIVNDSETTGGGSWRSATTIYQSCGSDAVKPVAKGLVSVHPPALVFAVIIAIYFYDAGPTIDIIRRLCVVVFTYYFVRTRSGSPPTVVTVRPSEITLTADNENGDCCSSSCNNRGSSVAVQLSRFEKRQ